MRIPSGVTDQYIYFVAVDATDLKARETGLSTWTVYRSRNGGAAAAFTTPTINETDQTNMPGVYELLLDEDMTIDSGDDSQEMVFHITHAGMAPVTRTIELYRPKITAGETLTVASGVGSANAVQISGDATAADNLETAYDDTAGSVPWAGVIDQGTAQSATGTTIVLRSAAGFADDELIGATVYIASGTGAGQSRVITDYVSATDTATVDTWTTTPSGTIVYKIFATPPASATAVPAVNLVQVGGSTTDVSALATNVAAILVDTGTTLPATLDTIDNFLDTEIAAILADTNELQTDWANGGRLDLLLDGAASAGDPWTTELPGAYGAGTAGKIVGDNLNATVSSRASQTSVDTVDDLLDTEVAAIKTVVDAVKVKTDQLAFTATNKVDANILNVNSQDIGATKPYDTAT